MSLEGILTAKISKHLQNYQQYKEIIFFLCIYKMVNITKETYENNGIEVITNKLGELQLNERHAQQQLGHNIYLHLQTNTIKNIKNADLN